MLALGDLLWPSISILLNEKAGIWKYSSRLLNLTISAQPSLLNSDFLKANSLGLVSPITFSIMLDKQQVLLFFERL